MAVVGVRAWGGGGEMKGMKGEVALSVFLQNHQGFVSFFTRARK